MKRIPFYLKGAPTDATSKLNVGKDFILGTLDAPTDAHSARRRIGSELVVHVIVGGKRD
jgi:hypothetical protein